MLRNLLFLALIWNLPLIAQVGVNFDGSNPDPSAGLDVKFTDKGFLPPRLTTAQRDAITDPAIGLMILNSDTQCMEYYRVTGWYGMCPKIPTLTTSALSAISGTTATSGGTISDDGGVPVTARGVCWSTSTGPTTADSFTSDGSGTGSFSSSLTGLLTATMYYVRAYASNSVGTAYGNEFSFTTSAGFPIITTFTVSNVSGKNAVGGGEVTDDGGDPVTTRGLCWSTSPTPTTADNTVLSGSGTGIFSAVISGLDYSTTYHVRAFATNNFGTGYGAEENFATTAGTLVSFTSVGGDSWTVPEGVEIVEYLVVGGGGGGGSHIGGGGGAGGYRADENYLLTQSSYTISVGGGGSGSTSTGGTAGLGGISAFGSIEAAGGGGGGSGFQNGFAGGSGGGGGHGPGSSAGGSGNTPSVSPSQGNSGGNGIQVDQHGGGGGGGAGGAGGSGTAVTGGAGGVGVVNDITGTSLYWCGGGGGTSGIGGGATAGNGGLGGGGGAGAQSPATSGSGGGSALNSGGNGSSGSSGAADKGGDGGANTGGGGGGGGHSDGHGGVGGSGAVYIRY